MIIITYRHYHIDCYRLVGFVQESNKKFQTQVCDKLCYNSIELHSHLVFLKSRSESVPRSLSSVHSRAAVQEEEGVSRRGKYSFVLLLRLEMRMTVALVRRCSVRGST